MFLFRKIMIFFALSLITSIIVFFIYKMHFPFDLSPVLVFALIIARTHGAWFSIAFIIIAGIVPMLIAGGSFDHTTLFYTTIFIIPSFIVTLFPLVPFVPLAMALMLLEHITGSGFAILNGTFAPKEIVNFFAEVSIDCIYISLFSGLLISLLS